MYKGITFVMPNDCQLNAMVTIDNLQLNSDYAGMLTGEFTTKLRLEVFVFTHDELMKVIREQAQRYARGGPCTSR